MRLQEIGADQDAAECEKGLMDIVTSFTSYAKPAKLMEPANRPFDDPTVDAQATSMLSVAFCQLRDIFIEDVVHVVERSWVEAKQRPQGRRSKLANVSAGA